MFELILLVIAAPASLLGALVVALVEESDAPRFRATDGSSPTCPVEDRILSNAVLEVRDPLAPSGPPAFAYRDQVVERLCAFGFLTGCLSCRTGVVDVRPEPRTGVSRPGDDVASVVVGSGEPPP
mmetsp:Transcript_13794/g.22720  ORF Transcript_13794/g.22720 Transcript_13794/m.22720 type:complete len:125 (+) Transcript_13794:132-506(+)